jgi:hypothetical protein
MEVPFGMVLLFPSDTDPPEGWQWLEPPLRVPPSRSVRLMRVAVYMPGCLFSGPDDYLALTTLQQRTLLQYGVSIRNMTAWPTAAPPDPW